MSASDITYPGESLANRLAPRMERRPAVGPRAAFYARFGLGDPWSGGVEAVGSSAASDGFSYLSSAAFYAQVSRWEARSTTWEARASRVGRHRLPAAARAWSEGAVARALRASLPDFVLPQAVSESVAVTSPVDTGVPVLSGRASKKPYEAMRPVESPWLSFESRPARVVRGGKVQEAAPLRAPRLDPRVPGAARAARRGRSLDRLRSRVAETAAQSASPALAMLPPAPELGLPVRRAPVSAGSAVRESAPSLSRRERRAAARTAVRSLGLVERLVAAPSVESLVDDAAASPVARAAGRSVGRGARTAVQRVADVPVAESLGSVMGARPAVGFAARAQEALAPAPAGRLSAPVAVRAARAAAESVVVSFPAGAPAGELVGSAAAVGGASRSSASAELAGRDAGAREVVAAPVRRWSRPVQQAASRAAVAPASGSLLPRVARWSVAGEVASAVPGGRAVQGAVRLAPAGDASAPELGRAERVVAPRASAARRALARATEPRLGLAPAPVAAVLAAASGEVRAAEPVAGGRGDAARAPVARLAPSSVSSDGVADSADKSSASAAGAPVRSSAASRAAASAPAAAGDPVLGRAPIVGSPGAGAAARAVARLDLTAPPAERRAGLSGLVAPTASVLAAPASSASAAGATVSDPVGSVSPAPRAARSGAGETASTRVRETTSGVAASPAARVRDAARVDGKASLVPASRALRPAERLAAQAGGAPVTGAVGLSASPLAARRVLGDAPAPVEAPVEAAAGLRASVRAAARLSAAPEGAALVPARARALAPEALLARPSASLAAESTAPAAEPSASAELSTAGSRAFGTQSSSRSPARRSRSARSPAPTVRAAARASAVVGVSETAQRSAAASSALPAATASFVRRASPLAHVRIGVDGQPSLSLTAAEAAELGVAAGPSARGVSLAEGGRLARAVSGLRRAAVAAEGTLPASPPAPAVDAPDASNAQRPTEPRAAASARPAGRPMDWMLVRTAASAEPVSVPAAAPAAASVSATATVDGAVVPVTRAGRSVVRTADGRFLPRSAARPPARGPALPSADSFVVPGLPATDTVGASAAGLSPGDDAGVGPGTTRPAPAARGSRPARVRGFARAQADLGYTLEAVERGRDDLALPVWARRSVGEPLVRGTGGDVLSALAKAQAPEEVVRVIVERGGALGTAASSLPAPVLQVIEAIRSEARSELDDAQKSAVSDAAASARAAAAQSPTPRSTARVVRGFTSLRSGPTARRNDGVGADGVMRLARRLQDLIHLAEGRGDRDSARKQVRMAEDSSAARAEGQGLSAGASAGRDPQVDVDALAREVFDVVTRELELRRERRQEDPDERSGWF